MNSAEIVAWVCFLVGIAVLGVGLYIGLKTHGTDAADKAQKQLEDAKQQLEDARTKIDEVRSELEQLRTSPLEAGGVPSTGPIKEASDEASKSTSAAKSSIEQIGSIIGALPENIRFAGMLVLVGTILIGVATVQFGGTSLF